MRLGAHLSIAGGLERALESAEAYGFQTVALFLRNQRQWKAPELSDDAVHRFLAARRGGGITPIVAHAPYLLNLAGSDDVRLRSLTALREDLSRCGRLGVEYLVLHPGSHPDRPEGIARIAAGVRAALDDVPNCTHVLLETMAGAGSILGASFEELAAIIAAAGSRRVGVCLDTCHVFAAGYDFRTPDGCDRMVRALDDAVGLDRLRAVHLNDSKCPLGSRRDRHEHIGHGCIGPEGFAALVNHPALADLPLILETPKGLDEHGTDWDARNAATIRGLASRPSGTQP